MSMSYAVPIGVFILGIVCAVVGSALGRNTGKRRRKKRPGD